MQSVVARISLLFSVVVIMLAPVLVSLPAYAQSEQKKSICGGANLTFSKGAEGEGFNRSCTDPPDGSGAPEKRLDSIVGTVINVLSIIVGIASVIMLIIAAMKYITSGGDSAKISSAKSTIVYALVGIVVVALAQILVKFVINETTTEETGGLLFLALL